MHIDLNEYVDLLTKIFDRVTHHRVVRGKTGFIEDALPTIIVNIKQASQEADDDENDGWDSCATEDDEEGFTYEDREGKRYKKKEVDEDEEPEEVFFSTRDPF